MGNYAQIQAAIDAAEEGNTILVDSGTYYENIDFQGECIVLRSTDIDYQDVVEKTVVVSGGNGAVVTCQRGESDEGSFSNRYRGVWSKY